MDRLANAGVRILRTDHDGAIHVLTDGTRLEITCFTACPDAAMTTPSMSADVPDHQQRGEKQQKTDGSLPLVVLFVLREGKRARGIPR